jgi:hypothetical protein
MSDRKIRELERKAAQGDSQAKETLQRERNRVSLKTIVDGWEGQWVYLEAGSNYAECGILESVFQDEIGRGILVMRHVRRKNNEDDNGPTWLNIRPFNEARIPTTEIVYAELAKSRWGDTFTPWSTESTMAAV